MWFVHSWSIELATMDSAALLSQLSIVGGNLLIPITFNNEVSQVISHAVRAMALYSHSAVDRATRDCFLVFQEIEELPRRIQKPLVDFLVVRQLAQSFLQYVVIWAAELDASNTPCPGFPARYLNKCLAACIWTHVGCSMNYICTKNAMSGYVIVS